MIGGRCCNSAFKVTLIKMSNTVLEQFWGWVNNDKFLYLLSTLIWREFYLIQIKARLFVLVIFPISFIIFFLSYFLVSAGVESLLCLFCRHEENGRRPEQQGQPGSQPQVGQGEARPPADRRLTGGHHVNDALTNRWWKTCWGWRILGGEVSQLTFVCVVMHSWSLKFYIENI